MAHSSLILHEPHWSRGLPFSCAFDPEGLGDGVCNRASWSSGAAPCPEPPALSWLEDAREKERLVGMPPARGEPGDASHGMGLIHGLLGRA